MELFMKSTTWYCSCISYHNSSLIDIQCISFMRTTISVEKETHEKLSQRGKKGDSFDKIINDPKFIETFGEVHGEKNSRLPKDLKEAAEKQPLIYNKGFYIYHTMPAEVVLKDDLIDRLLEPFEVAQPYIKFLTKPLSV